MILEEREALLASYALGTLSAPDIRDVERLIRSDPSAADEVAGLQEIAELIALAAPLQSPPPALREHVLAAARRAPTKPNRRRHLPTLSRFLPAAGMAAAVVIVSVWAVNLQQELDDLRAESALLTAVVAADARRLDQLAAQPDTGRDIRLLETQIQQTQSAQSILLDPEARSAELVPTAAAHGATGSYTWSASADAAVVALRDLPQLPLDDIYRVTLLDRWGNIVATKSVEPSPTGETMVVIDTPPGAGPQSVIVSATNPASDSNVPDGPVVLEVRDTDSFN